jgi:hypothetical protein
MILGVSVGMRALRDRWSTPELRHAVRDAVNALLHGESLESVRLPKHEGRFDLRGAWLASTSGIDDPELRRPGRVTPRLRGVRVADLDLTAATAQFTLQDCEMVNCVLDRVGWQNWYVEQSLVRDCSFIRADVRDSHWDQNGALLPGRRTFWHAGGGRSVYERCDFTRARMGAYAGWGYAMFDQCLFADTAFSNYAGGPQFFAASFRRCRFVGQYKSLTFGSSSTDPGQPRNWRRKWSRSISAPHRSTTSTSETSNLAG